MAKTIQITIPSDEIYESFKKQAAAEGLSMSEYGFRLLKMGELGESVMALKTFEDARREVDLELQRKQFALAARSVMLLEEISERLSSPRGMTGAITVDASGKSQIAINNPGIGINSAELSYIKQDAQDATDEVFAKSDELEATVEAYLKSISGEGPDAPSTK